MVEHAADTLIETFDHGGVSGIFVCEAGGELLFVFGEKFGFGCNGGMGGVMGEIEKEGFAAGGEGVYGAERFGG